MASFIVPSVDKEAANDQRRAFFPAADRASTNEGTLVEIDKHPDVVNFCITVTSRDGTRTQRKTRLPGNFGNAVIACVQHESGESALVYLQGPKVIDLAERPARMIFCLFCGFDFAVLIRYTSEEVMGPGRVPSWLAYGYVHGVSFVCDMRAPTLAPLPKPVTCQTCGHTPPAPKIDSILVLGATDWGSSFFDKESDENKRFYTDGIFDFKSCCLVSDFDSRFESLCS